MNHPYQPVVKVSRARERVIFRQTEAKNRRNTGGILRFFNEKLAKKGRSQRGWTFATGCYAFRDTAPIRNLFNATSQIVTQASRLLLIATLAVSHLATSLPCSAVSLEEPDRALILKHPQVPLPYRVHRSLDLIRLELLNAPACHDYFAAQGVDLDHWMQPEGPPFVVLRRLREARPSRLEVCGAALARDPFDKVFINPECFRRPQICDLASVILHEMGHLARRDTEDNEPQDFFDACRLSVCVDPGRFL